MASSSQIRSYLASWFQLNRAVIVQGTSQRLCPQPVLVDGAYSNAFEQCWKFIESREGQDCYLEGTEQTVKELITGAWDVVPCARCTLPIPMPLSLAQGLGCPCAELESWPNTQLPLPRLPENNQNILGRICHRVTIASQQYLERYLDDRSSDVDSPLALETK